MGRRKKMMKMPITSLNVGELVDILRSELFSNKTDVDDDYRGYDGLRRLLGCSRSKAYRTLKSGVLKEAIIPLGGSQFKINKPLAMQILRNQKENKGKKKNGEK
ncbi:MAG: DUF3853 family protein [Salinivirgaceae bacterium]|nr:DUF3853 family protein [Salinivirgaceae bacterium]